MDLIEAHTMANELISLHCPEYKFKFNNGKRIFGTCYIGKKTIKLSKTLTLMNEPENVKDTILHEIAHALTPNQHHNKNWQQKAIEIGCNGKRCYNIKEIEAPQGVGYLYCPECQNKIQKYRITKQLNNKACKRCYDQTGIRIKMEYRGN